MIESGMYECNDFEPHPSFEKFAELIEQECIDKFIKVWYEQGLDVRGADLGKFMLCYEELSHERNPT